MPLNMSVCEALAQILHACEQEDCWGCSCSMLLPHTYGYHSKIGFCNAMLEIGCREVDFCQVYEPEPMNAVDEQLT